MILLDTDTVSLFHAGHSKVVERMQDVDDSEIIAVAVVTQAEILRARYDFLLKAQDGEHLKRAQHWLSNSESLLTDLHVVPVDDAVADRFDLLRSQKRLGRIGHADLLIAVVALTHRATLVTRNLRHFRQIPGLKVENWAD